MKRLISAKLTLKTFCLHKALSSEIQKRLLEAGFLSRHTMTKSSIPDCLKLGSTSLALLVQEMVLARKVYGKTKMVFATGANSGSWSFYPKLSAMKVSGRTQERRCDWPEFSFTLTTRTLKFSLAAFTPLIKSVSMQTHWLSTTTTLTTCQNIKFPKSTPIRPTVCFKWLKTPRLFEASHPQTRQHS